MFNLVDDVRFHEENIPQRAAVQPVALSSRMLANMERTRKITQLVNNSDFYKPVGTDCKLRIDSVDLFHFRCVDPGGKEIDVKISSIVKGDMFYKLEPMPVTF
jgi:hypothetical protein